MMRKKTFICMIILTIICIPLLTNKLPEVTGAFSLTDAEVVGMEAVYSALDTVVYWDVEFTWYPYLTMKGCNWRIVGLDSTWRTYDYYLTDDTYNINCTRSARGGDVEIYRFYWNLTNFSPGDYTFESAPEGTASEASDTFGISSDPPSYYPQIDITAPEVFETFDSSLVTSITTSATLEDNGFLTDAEIFWDTTEVWNYTSFTPGENDKTYDITITEGVTTNDTHDITWTVTDNDGYEWNKTRHVIVYDGILMILMQKPDNYWQQDNNFDFQANFSESNGIDDARMYIYGCTFIGDDKVIVINNVESFLSYLQNYTISDDFYVHSYSLTYSDVQKWLIDYGYDDTGNKYGNRYGDWYVDDSGAFFTSLSRDLFVDDNGNIYSAMNDYFVDDDGTVYTAENDYFVDDNGNIYTADNNFLVDDSGNRFLEFIDGSEYVIDDGDYSSAIVSYEEDDMSLQSGVWTIDGTDFTKRNPFTITNPKAEAMQDIVIRVPITYDSDMQADMDDITITELDGTLYDYEQNDVVASTSCTIWIRFPTFASATEYELYMYYGHATSSSKADSGDTWTNYLQVYHFESSGYSSSTDNYGDLTNSGCDFVSGIVGNGLDIDGSTDYMYRTDTLSGGGYDVRTWLWWANIDTSGHIYHTVWGEHVGGDERVDISNLYNTGWAGWRIDTSGGGSDNYQADGLYNINTWYGHALTLDNNAVEYYLNGVSKSTDTNGIVDGGSANDLFVGKQSDGLAACWFDGELDELMVYNGRLTTNEIYVMYWSIAGNRASWSGEESFELNWNEGANFNWAVSDTTGERDADHMTFWNTTAGSQAYVYVSDDDLANVKMKDDNYAISFEINISCNDVTKIDAIGFSIEGTTGNYLKFALTRWGFGICGASTNALSTNGMTAGYTSTDISWDGSWTTLNITILGHSKVLYYYNDTLLRDSVDDCQYYDYTDVDCGSTVLSVDNYAGEINGNMTIDYFESSYFPGGRISSDGLLYYEYSDPSCTRYNGSWFLSGHTLNDVSAVYSNWGAGVWHPYRYMERLKFSTRVRFDNEVEYKYWNSVGMSIGASNYFIHIRMRDDIGVANKLQMTVGNHVFGGYASDETSAYISDDPFDGEWHVFTIEYNHDSYILGTMDGITIANITYASEPDWFLNGDPSNVSAGQFSWGSGNGVTGNYNAYMEIDYLYSYNLSYNWWTSSAGWDWAKFSTDGERTASGELIITRTSGDYHGIYGYGVLYPDVMDGGGNAEEYVLQIRVKMNDTETDYEYISLMAKLGGTPYYTANVMLWQNDTATISIFDVYNHHQSGTCYETAQISYEWVQDQWYNLTLVVDHTNEWIAGIIDGQLIGNISVLSSHIPYSDYSAGLFIIDGDSSATAKTCWIDYFQSGWRNDWWWTSSEGWNYNIQTLTDTVGYRDSGEIDIYSNIHTKRYVWIDDNSLYMDADHTRHLFEIRMKTINSSSEYDSFAFGSVKVSGWYASFVLFPNNTIGCMITNGLGLYTVDYKSEFAWTWDNDYHVYSILADYTNNWVAWIFDGQMKDNRSQTCTWSDGNLGFGFDNNGAVLAGVTIDYIQSGWRNDWAWVSSEGWSWSSEYAGTSYDRDGGSLIMWDTASGSYCGMIALDDVFSEYPYTDSEFYWETAITPNATTNKYEYIDFFTKFGSYYFHLTLYANDTLCAGVNDGNEWSSWHVFTQTSLTFTQNQQYTFRIVVGTNWVAYQYSLGGDFITVRQSISDYTNYYGNPVQAIIQSGNAGGQTNAFLHMDYIASGWRTDWAWVSSEGWDWTLETGIDYINRTDGAMTISTNNSYAKIYSPSTELYAYSSDAETDAFMVETRLRYLNSSDYQGIGFTTVLGNYGGWKKAVIFYDFGDSKFSCGIGTDEVFTYNVWSYVVNTSITWNQNSWTTLSIFVDNNDNWISYFINETLVANITNVGAYIGYSVPITPKITLDVTGADQKFLEMDYLQSGWRDDWWWISSSGWSWDTISTGTTVGYQNGTRDGTNGEFYFWSNINDGDSKITASQADGLNWSGSYWTTEIRFQICNTTSHYDYVGGSAWVGGDTYVKAFWEYGTSGFRYGMYNNTNGAGDISNSIVSSLDTTYYGTMDNDWHTLRFQMKQTSWLGIYLDEKLIYNYTAVGNTKYLTGTLANVSFSLDSDASQNTRMVKIDYLKTGWTYGEYWGQTQNNTFWQILDDDWFHSDGYRDDTNGVFDFWSKQDGDYANIYLDESYTNATGDAYYIGVNWTITNATGLYDYVSLATAVGGGNYFQMSWYGSTLEYGIDNTYLNGVFTDSLTTTLSWTPGTYHTWEYYIDLTGNIVTVWLDDVMLVNTTGWSAYLTGTEEDDLILGVDNDAGDTDAHVRVDSVFSGYKGWWSATYSEVGLTNYMDNTLPAAWGEDIMVVHNSTQQCRFDATLTLKVNSTYYSIFENATGTTRTSTWQITDYVWSTYFSEGAFGVSVYLSSDILSVYWHNFTMYYDITPPTLGVRLKPTEPTGVYYADYPPGLDIYSLEWGLNDGQDNLVEVDLNNGDRVYDWIVTQEKPENFPTQVEYITRIEGDHILLVRAIDNAGNEANETITFTIVRRKPITFSFKANSGDAIPQYIAEQYRIEINSFATDGLTGYTIYDTFALGIYDPFDQTLYYSASVSYTANIEVTLSSVYKVIFSNAEDVPVELTIQKTSGQQSFICAGLSDVTWYLDDETYKIIADPMGAKRTIHTQFIATDFNLAVTASGTNVLTLQLDFIEVDGMQGLSFSSITDMLNLATWGILLVVIISTVIILRRLRPPIMRIQDEIVPQIPLFPIKITDKKQWTPKDKKTSFSSGKPKKQKPKDGKWQDIFA